MKQLSLPSGEWLLVEVPVNASEFEFNEGDKTVLMFLTPTVIDHVRLPRLAKKQSYTLYGKEPLELTEEEAKGIVGKYYNGYENYINPMAYLFVTAISSFESLLTSNNFRKGECVILKIK